LIGDEIQTGKINSGGVEKGREKKVAHSLGRVAVTGLGPPGFWFFGTGKGGKERGRNLNRLR